MIPNFSVNFHLYDVRIKQGLTIRDLAHMSGLSKTQINDIENGKQVNPTIYTICCLSLALRVPLDCLFSIKS